MALDNKRRQELSDFLRTRRARIAPADVGLPPGTRRRTPGLRREEVSTLAGISATLYTWLEQGRDIGVSSRVLDSVARVLKLDSLERTRLFQLAMRQPPLDRAARKPSVSPLLKRLIDNISATPVLVMGRRLDVLAWNYAARAFFVDFETIPPGERNLLWLFFTNRTMRSRYVDWAARAQHVLAQFRLEYGRAAGDADFEELVAKLKLVSSEFAEWWPRHDVRLLDEGRTDYRYPGVGRLIAEYINFSVNGNPELTMAVLTPAPELRSIEKVRRIIREFKPSLRAAG